MVRSGRFNIQRTSIISLSLELALTIFYERNRPRGTLTKSFTVIVANSQLSKLSRWWLSRGEWRECWRDEAQTSSGSEKGGAIYWGKTSRYKRETPSRCSVFSLLFVTVGGCSRNGNGSAEATQIFFAVSGSLALADMSGLFWRPLATVLQHPVVKTEAVLNGVFSWSSLRPDLNLFYRNRTTSSLSILSWFSVLSVLPPPSQNRPYPRSWPTTWETLA